MDDIKTFYNNHMSHRFTTREAKHIVYVAFGTGILVGVVFGGLLAFIITSGWLVNFIV